MLLPVVSSDYSDSSKIYVFKRACCCLAHIVSCSTHVSLSPALPRAAIRNSRKAHGMCSLGHASCPILV